MQNAFTSVVPDKLFTAYPAFEEIAHSFYAKHQAIENWLSEQWLKSQPLFYTSVDLRNAGFKCAPVDTNLFPAGFNNLPEEAWSSASSAIAEYLKKYFPDTKQILLIPENHTRNVFYFHNVFVLQKLVESAGYPVTVGLFGLADNEQTSIDLPNGKSLSCHAIERRGNTLWSNGLEASFILLNQDLSGGHHGHLEGLSTPVVPALNLGWANRLKSRHFAIYQKVAEEFGQALGIDPWLVNPIFRNCGEINFKTREGEDCLERQVTSLLTSIEQKYKEYGIKQPPFAVVKADAGTYGMAVMMVYEPDEMKKLNRKQRNKMATTKGGEAVTKAIIQEGVYSIEDAGIEGASAEPVIYSISQTPVGGFYRIHTGKKANESLNAPGMEFQPFTSHGDLLTPPRGQELAYATYYTYGVVARLAALASAREMKQILSEQDRQLVWDIN